MWFFRPVHTTLQEFEIGGFSSETQTMFSVHTTSEKFQNATYNRWSLGFVKVKNDCDDHSFIYNRGSNMNYVIYILHTELSLDIIVVIGTHVGSESFRFFQSVVENSYRFRLSWFFFTPFPKIISAPSLWPNSTGTGPSLGSSGVSRSRQSCVVLSVPPSGFVCSLG